MPPPDSFPEASSPEAPSSGASSSHEPLRELPSEEGASRGAVARWARRIGPGGLVVGAVGLGAVGVVQADLTGDLIRWGLPVGLFLAGCLVTLRHVRTRWRGASDGEASADGRMEMMAEAIALRGVSFYGAMTSLTFGVLQVHTFVAEARSTWSEATAAVASPGLEDWVRGELWSQGLLFFIRVSVDTVLNLVWAAIWPLTWLKAFHLLPTFLLVAASFLAVRAVRLLAPAMAQAVTRWRMNS